MGTNSNVGLFATLERGTPNLSPRDFRVTALPSYFPPPLRAVSSVLHPVWHLQEVHVSTAQNDADARGAESHIFPQSDVFEQAESMGFVDLFAGAGGITIGFTRGGFRPLLSADFNTSVELTHRKNFPSIPFLGIKK